MSNDPASIRTPIGRIRYLGAARWGTTKAWHVRLTAIGMVPLTIAFIWLILSLVGKDYNAARTELANPFPAILLLLFIGAGIYHGKLGIQTIIEDYVRSEPAREYSLIANMFFAICVGLACVYAVLRISYV